MRSKKSFQFSIILTSLSIFPHFLQAQSSSNNVSLIAALIIIGALILVSAIVAVSENILHIEAKKYNVDSNRKNISLFPKISELMGQKRPDYIGGEDVIILDKGYDIALSGKPSDEVFIKYVNTYAVRPPNFRGISPIPKLAVAEKDEVLAGDELFFDKSNPDIKYCSPVSGEIAEIRRGAKRAITDIVILADKNQKYKKYNVPDFRNVDRDSLIAFLMECGLWPLINQRPYDVVPDPAKIPSNIFVSTFDSAPLAPKSSVIIDGNESSFQRGIDVLAKLTTGHVHLGLNANRDKSPSSAFVNARNAKIHWFRGKHPAGNVGVQIHHIAPIRGSQSVWTLSLQNVIAIGRMFSEGKYNVSKIITIGGIQSQRQAHYNTIMGANMGDLVGKIEDDKVRIIAGDVLSGRQVGKSGFMDATTDQITVIEEGDYHEMFGWLLPLPPRPSISKTFPNFLYPSLEFEGDTNAHGEKRAFVMTGEYEKVLPMNIYPQHLMKAILVNDFEQMEGLGIYELSEEDIALCEFVCTSKMPLQSILREGLDMMREQG